MNHPWTIRTIFDGLGRSGAEVSSNDVHGVFAKIPFVHVDEVDPNTNEVLVSGSELARNAAIEWVARWEQSETYTPVPVVVDATPPTQDEIDQAISTLDTSTGASGLGG